MSWSPDEETVVMVTGEQFPIPDMSLRFDLIEIFLFISHWEFTGTETVLEMTKDFDVITEFPINVEEIGEGS